MVLTLREALEALANGTLSSRELVETCLQRIHTYDRRLRSFITVREEAREEAVAADTLRQKGVKKPLLGIPVAIKDNFLTAGIRTTSADNVLRDYIPPFDATTVKRLKDAGAVIIGKTNLDAWGHGSSGEHTIFGVTRNPYAYDRVTGGSSSGSAAGVAAGFCLLATGSDTGGSNRQPASYCNVVGLKPTYGRVSRYGVIAMGSSTDSMGTITKSVWDAALGLEVLAGYDSLDATSSEKPVDRYTKQIKLEEPMRIGLPREFFDGLNSKVGEAVRDALRILEGKGHKLIDISLPHAKYAYPVYCLTVFSEISSNLARYNGIRYGNLRTGFNDEARRRIMIGTHALSAGYQDRYYKQASRGRTLIIRDFLSAFAKVDIIAGPVFPFPPFHHRERELDPLQMYLSDVITVPANLSGHPAISVPTDFADGLPNGLQLIAPYFEEKRLFQVGYQLEEELQMYKVLPVLKP